MYATVEQANAYISNYYSSTDSLRVSWEALQDADKQVLLNRAEQQIDVLPFIGKPSIKGKAFPRKPDEEYSLQQALVATVELAIHHLDSEAKSRFDLQAQGVKSYKIGDLSETFGATEGYTGVDSYVFSIVFPYLKDWIGGGYEICPTLTKKCPGRHVRR